MKQLTAAQIDIIQKIADIQLQSLGSLILEDIEKFDQKIKTKNKELSPDEVIATLVEEAEYYAELKNDPEIIFDLDEEDVPIFKFIIEKFFPEELKEKSEIQVLYEFIINFLGNGPKEIPGDIEDFVNQVDLDNGESYTVEFKSALIYHFTKKRGTQSAKYIIAKAICGMLNREGGKLYIGVDDHGSVQGLEFDYSLFDGDKKKKRDMFMLTFDNLIGYYFGNAVQSLVKLHILEYEGKDVAKVSINFSTDTPVFLLNRLRNSETGKYDVIKKEFYVRGSASTPKIEDVEEIIKYVRGHWGN